MQGTFFNAEYSYITASVSVNTSLLADSVLAATLFKGERVDGCGDAFEC